MIPGVVSTVAGMILCATVATDHAVVAVASAIRFAGVCVLDSSVAANQTVVTIAATVRLETIWTVRMRPIRPRSVRARTPRVIAVVVAAMPVIVGDVSIVVVDNRSATT